MGKSLTPLYNINDVFQRIDGFVLNKEQQAAASLFYIGEDFVNNARRNGNYTDRTGNLRSSIGYVVVNDGVIIRENMEGKPDGIAAGKAVINELLGQYNKGLVLIVVAGMEYAAVVEANNYDVISGSAPMANDLKKKLKENLGI